MGVVLGLILIIIAIIISCTQNNIPEKYIKSNALEMLREINLEIKTYLSTIDRRIIYKYDKWLSLQRSLVAKLDQVRAYLLINLNLHDYLDIISGLERELANMDKSIYRYVQLAGCLPEQDLYNLEKEMVKQLKNHKLTALGLDGRLWKLLALSTHNSE